jgi:hypothetical protein
MVEDQQSCQYIVTFALVGITGGGGVEDKLHRSYLRFLL